MMTHFEARKLLVTFWIAFSNKFVLGDAVESHDPLWTLKLTLRSSVSNVCIVTHVCFVVYSGVVVYVCSIVDVCLEVCEAAALHPEVAHRLAYAGNTT